MTDFEPSVTAARAKEKRNRHSKDLAMPHSSPVIEPVLATCPFCDGEMMFRKALWPSDGNVDSIIHDHPADCGMVEFSDGTIDESIIERWNTRASQPSTPERKAWLVKWKSKDTTTYYDEPPPPTASMESVTPIHTPDQCSAGSEDASQLRRAAWAQLNILDHWGAAPEASVSVTTVVFRNAAFTIRKLVDALPDAAATPARHPGTEAQRRNERVSMAREICLHRGENPNTIDRGGNEGWEKFEPLAGACIREAERLFAIRDAAQGSVSAEDIARTICLSYGRDADELTSIGEMCDADNRPVPIWMVYEEQADAILAAYSISSTQPRPICQRERQQCTSPDCDCPMASPHSEGGK